jgi:hypothetical protein
MELVNATRLIAGCNMGLAPDGRESLVVVIKGTFVLPKPGDAVRMHTTQLPLIMADVFSGEPGKSAPLFEIDFAPRKRYCDVLLAGSAYAPGGRPTQQTSVSLHVGPVSKACEVVGARVWEAGLTGIRASEPQMFTQLPISYDVAFGGVDQESEDPTEHDAYMLNPAGRGFRKQLKNAWVDGKPLPFTQELGQAVTWPTERYTPMAFGPVGRAWQQRACYGGTYDQRWLDDTFPFLPQDFDERYYQAAPLDQQMPIPVAPLEVSLLNFTPDGLRRFTLPHFEAPVQILLRDGTSQDHLAQLDTIMFEPDHERFSLTWRASQPLKRGMHEVAQVLVGRRGGSRWPLPEPRPVPIPVVGAPMPMPASTGAVG